MRSPAVERAVIFGASGFVGAEIYGHLKESGWDVLGTHYRHPEPHLSRYSYGVDNLHALIEGPGEIRYGIICGGISQIDLCKREPTLSHETNVVGVLGLAGELAELGITPVFLSSDYVFSGDRGGYRESDRTSPITTYGEQKVCVEEHLLREFSGALVVRMSKVFGVDPDDGTLLSEWHRAINRRETIRCAEDQWFSPTWVGDISRGLRRLLEERASGVYHLCHPLRYDRGTLLKEFSAALGVSIPRLELCKTSDFGFADNRGRDTSLSPEKFLEETGFSFTEHGECFRRFRAALGGSRASGERSPR